MDCVPLILGGIFAFFAKSLAKHSERNCPILTRRPALQSHSTLWFGKH